MANPGPWSTLRGNGIPGQVREAARVWIQKEGEKNKPKGGMAEQEEITPVRTGRAAGYAAETRGAHVEHASVHEPKSRPARDNRLWNPNEF